MTMTDITDAENDLLAAVEQRRSLGAEARDPVRFGIALALARRAVVQQGDARNAMAQRVQALLAALDAAPSTPAALPAHGTALAALSALVDRLGRTPATPGAVPRSQLQAAAPRPLKAVARFKGTWSRLRADQRLRQALAQVPAMAGPLNSSHVVNRALQELRALSPAYLDAVMAHAEALLWLEQASGGDLPLNAPRASRKG